jgi:vitamin B12 transporter
MFRRASARQPAPIFHSVSPRSFTSGVFCCLLFVALFKETVMKLKPYLLLAPVFFCAQIAYAQESSTQSLPTPTPEASPTPTSEATPTPASDETIVVVTATRTQRTLAQTTSAVTVVTRRQIEEKKPFDLVEAIRLAPGVSISQSGTQGKTTSIFLRGSNSNQTLVLLDGVRANSPADGRFDFGTVPVENIERIEIVRGPQSALYGSDAIGGVINIVTRRGTGEFQSGGRLELGSQGTNKQVISARGNGLSFSATRLRTNGFFDNDDYRNLGASLRFDKDLSANSGLTFTLRGNNGEVGTPGLRDFAFDPNARTFPRELAGSVQFHNRSGNRQDRVILGGYDRRFRFEDAFNPGDSFSSFVDSVNQNRVLTLDAQTSWEGGAHTFTIGGELRREEASVDSVASYGNTFFSRRTTTRALFVQDEYRRGALALVPGLRLESNSQYGSNLSGRLAASYDLSERSKIRASAGTGFKAPSFNDLYFPNYGNPDLDPEKSVGFDLGIEYSLPREGRLEVTAFRNQLRNLITGVFVPPFSFQAQNVNRATTQGVEIEFRQPLSDNLSLALNQTFLRTTSSGGPLLRRPRFNTTADLIYRRDKLRFDLGMVAQGERFDISPSFAVRKYKGYNRFDFTVGYTVRAGTEVYVRAQNILNKRYEEVAGFPSPRFNFVIGVQNGAF